jgi:hypothetical protein
VTSCLLDPLQTLYTVLGLDSDKDIVSPPERHDPDVYHRLMGGSIRFRPALSIRLALVDPLQNFECLLSFRFGCRWVCESRCYFVDEGSRNNYLIPVNIRAVKRQLLSISTIPVGYRRLASCRKYRPPF